jgi:hypothetical protein
LVAALVVAGIIVALIGIGLWAHLPIGLFVAIGLGGAIGGAFGLFVPIPMRARRHYRQYKIIQEPITAELTETGINLSTENGGANLQWSKIFQWRQNDRFVFVYSMPILFYLVPKSIAREGFDIALLVQRLAEHVGPER